MNIKQFEKAAKIVQEIKTLDAEIIEIEKQAMMIANGEVKIEVKLTVTDLAKKQEEEDKPTFDEDGSLSFRGLSHYVTNPWIIHVESIGSKKSDKKHEHKFLQDVNESEALQILGVLLYAKQTKRTRLIEKLNKIGIAV